MPMQKNEGGNDRVIRIVVGIVLILLARYAFTDGRSVLLYIIGIISVGTGITGFCGLYKLLGINTNKPQGK